MNRTIVIPGISIAAAALLGAAWAIGRAQSGSRSTQKNTKPSLPATVSPEVELTSLQSAIDRNNERCVQALMAADADAYAQAFTEDGLSLPGHDPVARGRDAIRDAVAETFKHARFSGGEIRTTETHLEGDTAYEVGDYAFQVVANGLPQTTTGRYLTVWKRSGGEWKIAIDAGQPDARS